MEYQEKYEDLLRKAWTDSEFKARLLANPELVLREEGWEFPAGMSIKVVENSEHAHYLVIPPSPPLAELDLEPILVGNSDGEPQTHCTKCRVDGC